MEPAPNDVVEVLEGSEWSGYFGRVAYKPYGPLREQVLKMGNDPRILVHLTHISITQRITGRTEFIDPKNLRVVSEMEKIILYINKELT
mgnify:CR=1 FL=1